MRPSLKHGPVRQCLIVVLDAQSLAARCYLRFVHEGCDDVTLLLDALHHGAEVQEAHKLVVLKFPISIVVKLQRLFKDILKLTLKGSVQQAGHRGMHKVTGAKARPKHQSTMREE